MYLYRILVDGIDSGEVVFGWDESDAVSEYRKIRSDVTGTLSAKKW